MHCRVAFLTILSAEAKASRRREAMPMTPAFKGGRPDFSRFSGRSKPVHGLFSRFGGGTGSPDRNRLKKTDGSERLYGGKLVYLVI